MYSISFEDFFLLYVGLLFSTIAGVVGGADANLYHPLYFLQHCQGANMDILEIVLLLIYTYIAHFVKILRV